MKRKLEDADDGFFENPTKMLPTATGGCSGNIIYQVVGSSPEQIGRPILASTPQGIPGAGGRQRPLPTARRIPTTTFKSNPAADNELRHVIDNFVSVYEQLDKTDSPDVKPNYSYSELAYLAMLRSPNFCLPIGQIYSYIQSRFKFFKNSTRKHWKNAVRHSLAKTMCFSKIQVGRGASNNERLARSTYLWCILPNSIACFARGDYRATVDKESGTNTLRSAYFRMNSEPFWNSIGDYIANNMAIFRKTLEESQTPGHIFESQTCSLPRKQDISESENRPPQSREAFQRVQNQPHIDVNMQSRDCGFTPTTPSPVYLISHSPEVGLPPAQLQISPNTHMQHTQAHCSSPVLRMPETQPQSQSSFKHRTTPSGVADPWLPGFAEFSPEQSYICSESDRRTPPRTAFDCTDSGYLESSMNDNSCKFLKSCNQQNQNRYLTSPVNIQDQFTNDQFSNNEYDLNQFDLSPFSLSDFSDFGDSIEQPRITPEKATRNHVIYQKPHYVGQPMYISTPVANQTAPVTQCRYIYPPTVQIPSYGHQISPMSPVSFVDGPALFPTAMMPQWTPFC